MSAHLSVRQIALEFFERHFGYCRRVAHAGLSKFDDFLGYHPRRRIIGQFHPEFPAYRFELPAQELDPREMV